MISCRLQHLRHKSSGKTTEFDTAIRTHYYSACEEIKNKSFVFYPGACGGAFLYIDPPCAKHQITHPYLKRRELHFPQFLSAYSY
ncbi:NUDIX domain-containing protein [Histoplasma ohiense]|nr:NUDIX domain-containing protein [Histoplasma ohiense (nom. inval.)]